MDSDYTTAPWIWKLQKASRYIQLYGPAATLSKVRSQYHMRADSGSSRQGTSPNGRCRHPRSAARFVAIIGCGKFGFSVVARHLHQTNRQFLRAAMDLNLDRAASLNRHYGGAYATTDLMHLLHDRQVRLVYITSNHRSHAEYAIACIEAGKAVHIEKPHAVTIDQMSRLLQAMRSNPHVPVYLGFNRPRSAHFTQVLRAIEGESGPTAINWFIAGHEIDADHWYFSPEEGGRVLGNMCHWLDASIHLVGLDDFFPCTLVPSSLPGSMNDFCITIQCADQSLATVSFSAKGHTFEGVREVLNVQRGSTVALVRDFHQTRVEAGTRRLRFRTRWRSHGHSENVLHSYRAGTEPDAVGESARYVVASGMLSLAARESLEKGVSMRLEIPDGFLGEYPLDLKKLMKSL
jgi:predicted dehydrogenase